MTDEDDWRSSIELLLTLSDIDISLDKTSDLSNGDTVTVTLTYPDSLEEKLGVRIRPKSGSSWKAKISDLEEATEVDIFKYFPVSFSGYNGYGTASVSEASDYILTCTLSKTEGLTNGEQITLTVKAPSNRVLSDYCAEKYGIIPKESSCKVTVYALEEADTVDLFEDVDVTLTGYSPYLGISVYGKYEHKNIGYNYVPSDSGYFAIGDTVTIEAYVNDWVQTQTLEEKCLDVLSALPSATTYSYTIGEDTPYYILETEQLSEEHLNELIAEAKDHFDSSAARGTSDVQNCRYYGYYLQTVKRYKSYGSVNCIYIIHEIEYTEDDETYTHYNVVKFTNVIVDKKGECHYDSVDNLYSWVFTSRGVDSVYDFEKNYITANAADYKSMQG